MTFQLALWTFFFHSLFALEIPAPPFQCSNQMRVEVIGNGGKKRRRRQHQQQQYKIKSKLAIYCLCSMRASKNTWVSHDVSVQICHRILASSIQVKMKCTNKKTHITFDFIWSRDHSFIKGQKMMANSHGVSFSYGNKTKALCLLCLCVSIH